MFVLQYVLIVWVVYVLCTVWECRLIHAFAVKRTRVSIEIE